MWWLVCQGWLRECCMQDCRAAVWSDTPLDYCSIDCSVLYDLKYSINEAYLQLMGSISLVSISSNKISSLAWIWCLHSLWDDPGARSGVAVSPEFGSITIKQLHAQTTREYSHKLLLLLSLCMESSNCSTFPSLSLVCKYLETIVKLLRNIQSPVRAWNNFELVVMWQLWSEVFCLSWPPVLCSPLDNLLTSDQCILAWVFNLHNWETYKECRRRQDLSLLYDCVALCGT